MDRLLRPSDERQFEDQSGRGLRLPSIGTSQADPRPTFSPGDYRSAKRWKASLRIGIEYRRPALAIQLNRAMVQLPAAIGKVTLSPWLLELWQFVPHPGLID